MKHCCPPCSPTRLRHVGYLFWLILLAMWPQARGQEALPMVQIKTGMTAFGETNQVQATWQFISDKSPVTIRYEFAGTATPNVDYDQGSPIESPSAMTATIPAGTNSVHLSVRGLKDFINEPQESVIVRILPDVAYSVGEPGTGTFILYNNNTPKNILPHVKWTELPKIPLESTNVTLTAMGGDLDGLEVEARFFANGTLIYSARGSQPTNLFTTIWTEARPGIHELKAEVTDDRGATAQAVATVVIGEGIEAPADRTTISYGRPNDRTFTDISSQALVEWNLPMDAADHQYFLWIQNIQAAWYHNRIWVYEGDPNAGPGRMTLDRPREYIGSMPNGLSVSNGFFFDLTKAAARLAGKKLGVLIDVDPAEFMFGARIRTSQYLPDIVLLKMPGGSIPPRPTLRWQPGQRQFTYGQPATLRGELFTHGSVVSHVEVFNAQGSVGTATLDLPTAAETNTFSITVTNLPMGTHYLRGRAQLAGTNFFGEDTVIHIDPVDPFPHKYIQTGGASRSFIVLDRAGRAHVWGRNDFAQLGLGFTNATAVSSPVTLLAPNGGRWRSIVSAGDHSAGLTEDRSFWSWGYMQRIYLSPAQGWGSTNGGRVMKIAALSTETEALDTYQQIIRLHKGHEIRRQRNIQDIAASGTSLIAIQQNPAGIWESRTSKIFPPPEGKIWTQIATCNTHSLALASDGQMYAWGDNNAGQLPLAGAASAPRLAAAPPGASGWTMIAAGVNASLAVDAAGRLWTWGKTNTGALAPALNAPALVSVPEDVTGWLDIAATDFACMALAEDGRFFVWGEVDAGVLPDKAATVATHPTVVARFPNVTNPDATDVFVNIKPLGISGGALRFQFTGPAGASIPLQASEDLMNWMTITNLANPGTRVNWATSVSDTNLFFRVHE